MQRLIILYLVCLVILCLYIYSAREEARLQQQMVVRRGYYERILREEKSKEIESIRRRQFVHHLAASASLHGWTHAIRVAKTYHTGCYPDFKPNPYMASSIYRAIILKCDDSQLTSEAQGLLHQCTHMTLFEDDVAGSPLPLEPGNTVIARIQAMIKVPPIVSRKKPPPAPVPRTDIDRLIDAQNSHDHGVTASMKTTLDALRAEGGTAIQNAKEELETLMFSENFDMTDEAKAKALAVLDSLQDDHVHSTFGVTERNALGLVWSKLGPDGAEILCKQLASGFERGSPVCSTGKIARIVSALDGVATDTRPITPMWVVREELGSLAAKVRTDALNATSELWRAAYERGDAADLEDAMRADFTQQALQTYCEDLGMEPAIIQPLVDDLATGF